MEKFFNVLLNLILPLWAKTMLAAVSKKITKQFDVAVALFDQKMEALKKAFGDAVQALSTKVDAFILSVNTRLDELKALLEQYTNEVKETLKTQWAEFVSFRTTQEQTNQSILKQIQGIKTGTVNVPINTEVADYNDAELTDVLRKEVGEPTANASYRIENTGAKPINLRSDATGEKYSLENQEFLIVSTDENGKVVKVVPGTSIEGEIRESQIREVRSDVTTSVANLEKYANETFQTKDNYEYTGDYGEKVITGICNEWLEEK